VEFDYDEGHLQCSQTGQRFAAQRVRKLKSLIIIDVDDAAHAALGDK
jgi:hypothetical protein